MPRLRKLRKKQKYQYHINRRRLNKKNKKLPRINCDAVRDAWDETKSVANNLTAMGLVADANNYKNFRIPSGKQQVAPAPIINLEHENEINSQPHELPETVKKLEETARNQFVEKKSIANPLPPEMYKKLTKFLDKHGEDFEAMARDHTNYYQETPAQLRSQVNRLKKIPQQWIPYLKERGLIESKPHELLTE